jgi:hypothetical protein
MREGLIPVILGTVVTATGVALRGVDMKNHGMTRRDTKVAIGSGLLGLGLAHIILGSIDLVQQD